MIQCEQCIWSRAVVVIRVLGVCLGYGGWCRSHSFISCRSSSVGLSDKGKEVDSVVDATSIGKTLGRFRVGENVMHRRLERFRDLGVALMGMGESRVTPYWDRGTVIGSDHFDW